MSEAPVDPPKGTVAAAPSTGTGEQIHSVLVPGVVVTPPAEAPPAPAAAPAAPTKIPWLGLTAVLLGTFISTLNTRLSNFGLADIRGAVHAGFDDGAWITTSQTMAQMLICPIAVWMGTVYGPRKVLLEAATAFAVIALIEPFSPQPSHVAGIAVHGRPGDGVLRTAHAELRVA